ncbi:hypothetical protein KCP70_14875 [Salmonella enterica subsp. enterica]|nr:hypothetical protein KCP70_14875 [Salmonella enterica subsp. enterica]
MRASRLQSPHPAAIGDPLQLWFRFFPSSRIVRSSLYPLTASSPLFTS